MKKAFLATFEVTTRVIVDTDADGISDEVWEKIGEVATKKILSNPTDYIHLDNLGEVMEDTEVPYNDTDRAMEKDILHKELNETLSHLTFWEVDDIETTIEKVKKLDGVEKVEFVDSKIDDGCDDDINQYVMMNSYDITYKGETFYVRFFYGDTDGIVGSFEIND